MANSRISDVFGAVVKARKTSKSDIFFSLAAAFSGAFSLFLVVAGLVLWNGETSIASPLREDSPHVTILAEPGLEEAITLLTRRYTQERNVAVTVNYISTPEYMEAVADGKKADLVVTGMPKWTQQMKQRGLLDVYSVTNLVRDEAVLAVPVNAQRVASRSKSFTDKLEAYLKSGSPFYVVRSTNAPLGQYTVSILEKAAKNSRRHSNDNRIPFVVTVSGAKEAERQLVGSGNGAAILLSSSVSKNPKLRAEATVPEDYYDPAVLQAAVVAGENMQQARDLQEYMTEPKNLEMFYKFGYRPIH